jgi:dTDP-4-dehydrorhamnose 3,5-epimerase
MNFLETPLRGAYVVETRPFVDDRGLFARTFCKNEFKQIGHSKEFVQFNHSVTTLKGTIRGMHFQTPPYSEIKLIRCIRGKVYDVIIDIREGSPTFLKYFGTELSEENMLSLYIPEGFAHGFQTLEDNSQLVYHHTSYYEPGYEGGIRYSDPLIGIKWPLDVTRISEKDNHYALLNNFNGIKL